MALRWPKALWWAIPSVARGTTPVSVFAPVRRFARRRLTRSPAGRLKHADFNRGHEIELLLNTRVAAIDPRDKSVQLANGSRRKFDALLLATGAAPVKLRIPGADSPHVCYLRSQSDCRAIMGKVAKAKRVVLVGASFIAMEVAASLIQRKLEVHVVAPEAVPCINEAKHLG
jgi:NAD(P)H-nitrite reductase large subunit